MKKIISQEEMINNYQEFCNTLNKINNISNYAGFSFYADYGSFADFYKGIDCTQCTAVNGYYPAADFKDEIIYDQGQVAFFNDKSLSITNSEKSISMSNEIVCSTVPVKKGNGVDGLFMMQATPNGVYEASFSKSKTLEANNILWFYSNATLLSEAKKYNLTLDEIKFRFVHGYSYSPTNIQKLPCPKVNVSSEDFAMLCNKIYREGLPYVAELARSGGTLEITEEDRKFYEENTIEQDIAQTVQISHSNRDNVELDRTVSIPSSASNIDNRNELIESLIALKKLGVELSPEQNDIVSLHKKLNSDKFQQYKNNSEARKERLEQVRSKIAAENEIKENWFNSPENPTNKRVEELKNMKKQIEALENLRDIDASLLSAKQKELIEKGTIFLEMVDIAKAENHMFNTAMSPEIRKWYHDYYNNAEGKSRK